MVGHADLLAGAGEIRDIWSWRGKWGIAREIWRSVLKHQFSMGALDDMLPDHVFDPVIPYHTTQLVLREDRVKSRETVTRHDVKAHIDEWNSQAGYEFLHIGLTSADIVDNVALVQMLRTMNVLSQFEGFEAWRPPFRGLKGAIGTQQDLIDIMGSPERVRILENEVGYDLGWSTPQETLINTGQVYPRSIDLQWASYLHRWCFREPWQTLSSGFLAMITAYSGSQWNEGDVSTSVVRRVALPSMAAVAYHALHESAQRKANQG